MAKRRMVEDSNQSLVLAWSTAALNKRERLPSLQSLLRRSQQQSQSEMLNTVRSMSRQYGIPMKVGS